MRNRLAVLIPLAILFAVDAFAATAVWDHSDSYPAEVTGYHLYWGTAPGSTANSVTVQAAACTPHPTHGGDCWAEVQEVIFEPGKVYYFAADAFGPNGSSALTDPVSYVRAVIDPGGGSTGGGSTPPPPIPQPPKPPAMIGVYGERP